MYVFLYIRLLKIFGGFVKVETISNVRRDLLKYVARFRIEGLNSEPIVFGEHRNAEAVVVPLEMFQLLLDIAEDIAIAERIRERASADTGARSSLAEVAADFGKESASLQPHDRAMPRTHQGSRLQTGS